MEQTATLAEKIALTKVWACEILSLCFMGVSFSLHEVNEVLQTVAIIISIIGGLGAIWNSFRKKQ